MAAEAAHRHWEAIEAALVAGIENGTGESRARAAERWLRLTVQDATVELRERAERRVEPDRYVAMSDDDVRAEFARALALAIRSGELDARTIMGELLPAADIVEAEAVGEAPAA